MHLHETTTRERVLKLDETEILEAIKAHYKLEDWDSYVLTVEKRDQGCVITSHQHSIPLQKGIR